MRTQRGVELIKRHAGFNRNGARRHVDFKNATATRAHVQHQRLVHALTRQTCSAATGQYWNFTLAAIANNINRAFRSIQNHHANRFNLIHAGVGGVQHAIMFFKAHLAHIHRAQIIGGALAQLRQRGNHRQMNRLRGIRKRVGVRLAQGVTIVVA